MRWTSLLIPLAMLSAPSFAEDADLGIALLEAEVARLAENARGVVGVGALHLESGQSLYLNADETFPMASTFKVPMAVKMLSLVDKGERSLDENYIITGEELLPTHSAMSEHLLPGSALTLENLIALMLQYSDNVATDIVLDMAGGAQAVTGMMRDLNFDIRVHRPTSVLIMHSVGRTDVSEDALMSKREYEEALDQDFDLADLEALAKSLDSDPRDTATPRAMTQLLAGIWRRELLSEASSKLLIDIMYGTKTGRGRLKGMLPPGTQVSHKTGTIGMTTNDVGIIDLPHGAGHLAVTVFIKSSRIPDYADREPVIAQIARALHDYFMFEYGRPWK